jgi:hypothetical protein
VGSATLWISPLDRRQVPVAGLAADPAAGLTADLEADDLKGKDLTLLAVVTATVQRRGLVTLMDRVNISNMSIHTNEWRSGIANAKLKSPVDCQHQHEVSLPAGTPHRAKTGNDIS